MLQPKWGIAALTLVGLAACTRSPETATTKEELKTVEPSARTTVPVPARVAEPKPAVLPSSRDLTIASGTPVTIRTTSQLSTKTATAGERFTASLESPLSAGGKVVAPKGAEVEGVVSNSDSGGRVKGVASLSLRVDRISIHGKSVPVTTSTFVQRANASKKKDALKVGIGAGLGAAIGAIAGGGRGAAIGAGAGGAGGTAVVLATKGNPAVVPAETVLAVTLTAPVTVRD